VREIVLIFIVPDQGRLILFCFHARVHYDIFRIHSFRASVFITACNIIHHDAYVFIGTWGEHWVGGSEVGAQIREQLSVMVELTARHIQFAKALAHTSRKVCASLTHEAPTCSDQMRDMPAVYKDVHTTHLNPHIRRYAYPCISILACIKAYAHTSMITYTYTHLHIGKCSRTHIHVYIRPHEHTDTFSNTRVRCSVNVFVVRADHMKRCHENR
jgi:hypothetical protein